MLSPTSRSTRSFVENQIEYCLGIELRDDTLFAFVSQNDADPVVVEIAFGALEFMPFVQSRIR
jgi:hypothetical protein